MSAKFHLVLVIHAHQPSGNFEHVFEKCYVDCYLPFIEALEKHPSIHMGLHYSGPLLTWIEERHREYFGRIQALVAKGQVEMLGGGFYEPILISIPPADQREQITRLADYVEKHFAQRPAGAWLAERVWEPQLPSVLAAAGVGYTIVDDIHFESAGFEPGELFADYIAEDGGHTIRLIPGQKILRYLIPFGTVEQVIAYFQDSAHAHPGGMAAMGDDMEKFGVWPGTLEHCYKNGWLERFFSAVEENASWLQATSPKEYFATHTPQGRADLPTASYTEMMEWALPTPMRSKYNALLKEFGGRADVLAFLRGGSWRGFFRKYSESNLLHKKMLHVSRRVASAPAHRKGSKAGRELLAARDFLLRAQCNDAYWHGIFGGLYAPHLRTEPWRNLIRAEAIVDRQIADGLSARVESLDYDGDGRNELLFTAPSVQALVKPSDGATVAAIDFRPTYSTLINSLQRRRETYHERLRDSSYHPPTAIASIHEQTRVKEQNLERFLRYDRWARHTFRLFVFDPTRTHADYENLELGEDASFAGGDFTVVNYSAGSAEFRSDFSPGDAHSGSVVSVTKIISADGEKDSCEVTCKVKIAFRDSLRIPVAVGIESVINLLAPGETDRFFVTPSGQQNLRFRGVLPGPELQMEDGWQGLRVALRASPANEFWVAPIETVSESEDGFERVYQGSQILAVWRPDVSTVQSWSCELVLRVAAIR